MLWRSFLNKQFRALDGRRFGLFTGFVQAGDAFLGGDGFHGVLESVSDGLTATPGGGQANALRLVSVKNRLTVVATGGDSIMLPASNAGMHILVVNDGAASAQAFGEINTLDTIDGVATGTGIVLPSGSRVYFECTTTGVAGTPGAWSSNAAVAAGAGVASFNTRIGPVTLTLADIAALDLSTLPTSDPGGGKIWINGGGGSSGALWTGPV